MQTFALELLNYADNIRTGERSERELRYTLIASGLYDAERLLGMKQASDDTEVVDSSTDPDAVEDYSAVEWESPSTSGEEGVMNDLEAFNRAMAANEHVSVGEDEGGEWL